MYTDGGALKVSTPTVLLSLDCSCGRRAAASADQMGCWIVKLDARTKQALKICDERGIMLDWKLTPEDALTPRRRGGAAFRPNKRSGRCLTPPRGGIKLL